MRNLQFFLPKGGFLILAQSLINFFDPATRYDALNHNGDVLELLVSHMPWEDCPALVAVLRHSKRKQGERPPFAVLIMFEILVLHALYKLSDEQSEYQIRDRLSFMGFLALGLESWIPKPSGCFGNTWVTHRSWRPSLRN
ncbi:MAG: transposase [Nitrospira sp.]|nr:transposase [Nitrospira sp.]